MPITKPIPEEAMPMVLEIREKVPKPHYGDFLPSDTRESVAYLREQDTLCCPMGMLPDAEVPLPDKPEHFKSGVYDRWAIISFFFWWDSQTDAEAAVNAVWGT